MCFSFLCFLFLFHCVTYFICMLIVFCVINMYSVFTCKNINICAYNMVNISVLNNFLSNQYEAPIASWILCVPPYSCVVYSWYPVDLLNPFIALNMSSTYIEYIILLSSWKKYEGLKLLNVFVSISNVSLIFIDISGSKNCDDLLKFCRIINSRNPPRFMVDIIKENNNCCKEIPNTFIMDSGHMENNFILK